MAGRSSKERIKKEWSMSEHIIYKLLTSITSHYTDVKKRDILPESNLKKDLGLSSFDLVSIEYEIEEKFGMSCTDDWNEFTSIQQVSDISKLIEMKLQADRS
jgi:hypothetical protein